MLQAVVSKVRTIRKILIISKNDIKSFIKVVKYLTSEISGSDSLILVSDEIENNNVIKMINCYNPDVVLNLSKLENEKIEKIVNRSVYSFGKRSHLFKTDYYNWDVNPEAVFNLVNINEIGIVYNDCTEINPKTVNAILKLGIYKLTTKHKTNIKASIFRNCTFRKLDINKPTEKIKSNEVSLISVGSFFNSGSYSIISETNAGNCFSSQSAVVVGRSNNLKSLTYFWNEKALYGEHYIDFIDVTELSNSTNEIKKAKFFISFEDVKVDELIFGINPEIQKLEPKYYYNDNYNSWQNHNYLSYNEVNNDKLIINHPLDKSFSKYGVQCIMLEISGIKESYLPQEIHYENLFFPNPNFPHETWIVNKTKTSLSIYMLIFGFTNHFGSIYQEIRIPKEAEVLELYNKNFSLNLLETDKSLLFKSTSSLVNNDIRSILQNRSYFDLLVKITPKRISKILSQIEKSDKEVNGTELLQSLSQIITFNSDIIVEYDNLKSKYAGDKINFLQNVEKLVSANILIRGRYFTCPICGSPLWFSISNLAEILSCYCCNKQIRLPLAMNNKQINDSFRLNELMINAIDQGQFTMLLTWIKLMDNTAINKLLFFNLLAKDGDESTTDIDIFAIINNDVVLFEVKSNRRFNIEQTASLCKLAKKMNISKIGFSTLLLQKEISDFSNEIKTKYPDIQFYFLTSEILFSQQGVKFSKW